jgi:hypothetical protein
LAGGGIGLPIVAVANDKNYEIQKMIITDASGWYVDDAGRVVLVAEMPMVSDETQKPSENT